MVIRFAPRGATIGMRLLALPFVLVAVAVAGCGSSSSSSSSSAPSASSSSSSAAAPAAGGGSAENVTIKSFMYMPASIKVKTGGTVTFDNVDNAEHTATADSGSFDTGTLPQGGSKKTVTFSKAGTFAFHCSFHPFMHGTVVVGP